MATTNVPVTGIALSPSNPTVYVGKSVQMGRTITTNATNRSVTWNSSNTGVAVVNNDGWITGVAPGTATITASLSGFSHQTTVTVSRVPSSYSTRLKGGNTDEAKYGLAKSISVMPGDVITTEVFVKYVAPSTTGNAVLTNLMSTIATGSGPVGLLVDGGAVGSAGGIPFPFSASE